MTEREYQTIRAYLIPEQHIYLQNNDDMKSTACAKCGLDLRNPIHSRAID